MVSSMNSTFRMTDLYMWNWLQCMLRLIILSNIWFHEQMFCNGNNYDHDPLVTRGDSFHCGAFNVAGEISLMDVQTSDRISMRTLLPVSCLKEDAFVDFAGTSWKKRSPQSDSIVNDSLSLRRFSSKMFIRRRCIYLATKHDRSGVRFSWRNQSFHSLRQVITFIISHKVQPGFTFNHTINDHVKFTMIERKPRILFSYGKNVLTNIHRFLPWEYSRHSSWNRSWALWRIQWIREIILQSFH